VTAYDDPRACGAAIAVPLTRERFIADRVDARKQFVRQWTDSFPGFTADRLWAGYQATAGYGRMVAAEAEAAGVRVMTDAALSAWRTLAQTCHVLTLFAHWASGDTPSIEYADGIVPLQEAVDALPRRFDGVVDLTVCHSTQALAMLKRARPRCTVLANRDPAWLDVRLAIYRQIIRLLQRERLSYVDAAQRVHLAALEVM
jgi:hypothetical protein